MIESNSNTQIKNILHLKKSAKFRRKSGLFITEGWKMADEAIKARLVKKLFIAESQINTLREKLPEGVVLAETVSDRLFMQISDTKTPQGILAIVKMPVYDYHSFEGRENCSFLCLEDIRDPGNIGTMMRSAEGAGFTGVILSKGTVDLFNPKVVRATMGSLFRVPFFIAEDFIATVNQLKVKGFTVYAAHLQGERLYDEENYEGNIAVLIGSEANGLTKESSELAAVRLKIPMEGKLESLNAAVCASILMYEVRKKQKIKTLE